MVLALKDIAWVAVQRTNCVREWQEQMLEDHLGGEKKEFEKERVANSITCEKERKRRHEDRPLDF